MTKREIEQRIDGLNKHMLSNSDKKLIVLSISSDYTYNKAIAIIDKDMENVDWYSVNYKNCFKTWADAENFLDGLCLGTNIEFNEKER